MRAFTTLGTILGLLAAGACRSRPAPRIDAEPPPAPVASAAADAGADALAPSATAGAATPPPPALPPEEARRLEARAERCLADPRCRIDEATRLYGEAVGAGALERTCFDLYYGGFFPADAARARACFEQHVAAAAPCDGSSPSLERTFLGLMLLDAQGGPRERERGEALFSDCHTQGGIVIGFAADREKTGSPKPIDYCADGLGTTQDIAECYLVGAARARFEGQKAMKAIFAELAVDDAGAALWSRARTAWERFSTIDEQHTHDEWADGLAAPAAAAGTLEGDEGERPDLLRALLAPAPAADPPEKAEAALRRAEARALAAERSAALRKQLGDLQRAWRAYRDAETAFVRRAYAKRYGGEEAAARAAAAELTRRRTAALGAND